MFLFRISQRMSTVRQHNPLLVQTPDGEKISLLPGQQLVRLPDGCLRIVNPHESINILNQPGVSLIQSCENLGRLATNPFRAAVGSTTVEYTPDQGDNEGCVLFSPPIWDEAALEQELHQLASMEINLFFRAVISGHLKIAKVLHNHRGVDTSTQNWEGKTALHIACEKGHKDLVEWLLDQVGVNLEQRDIEGNRAIHYAVMG